MNGSGRGMGGGGPCGKACEFLNETPYENLEGYSKGGERIV